jgi:hypothetical protein
MIDKPLPFALQAFLEVVDTLVGHRVVNQKMRERRHASQVGA